MLFKFTFSGTTCDLSLLIVWVRSFNTKFRADIFVDLSHILSSNQYCHVTYAIDVDPTYIPTDEVALNENTGLLYL